MVVTNLSRLIMINIRKRKMIGIIQDVDIQCFTDNFITT